MLTYSRALESENYRNFRPHLKDAFSFSFLHISFLDISLTEKTALLRNAIEFVKRGTQYSYKKQKITQKINLLDMPDTEKIKTIRELKQDLRQKIIEASCGNPS